MERLGGGGRRSAGESGGHQEALTPLWCVPFLFESYWDGAAGTVLALVGGGHHFVY